MIKTFAIAALCLATSTAADATGIKDALRTKPDSICQALSRNNILDMVDFKEANMKAEVANRLGGKSEMTELSDNYTRIKLSDNCTVEMKTFNSDGEEVICVVQTYTAPEAQSTINFYDGKWQKRNFTLNEPGIEQLTAKPDTMQQETYDKLLNNIWPVMKKISLNPDNDNIDFSLSLPLINDEEKSKTKCILTQKSVKFTDVVLIK